MKADQATTDAVINVLTAVPTLHRERKLEELLALYSPDDVYLIGTDKEDRRSSLAAIREQLLSDFKDPGNYTFELKNMLVSSSGNIAWVAADALHFNTNAAGERDPEPARLTAVLEKRADKWLICQWHKSRPYEKKEK